MLPDDYRPEIQEIIAQKMAKKMASYCKPLPKWKQLIKKIFRLFK